MWEMGLLILCMGQPLPDMSNCQAFKDTRGPYETEAQCLARVEEVRARMPPLWAGAFGYFGPVAVNRPGCELPGVPT